MPLHLPLARKYRPQSFDDLIGQPHVTTTLKRSLETQRLAQAYLFTGQRGVGKTSAARILAKCLNCAKGPKAKPCQTCPSCAQITQGSSLDVIEIDGASNRGIDEIRSLRETVPFAPTSGSFRVYIIDEVHMLTTEAFNALLKTLEEPPAHVKFIFATTAVNKVPATILSRCQRFDFRRIDVATAAGLLKGVAKAERLTVSEPALYAIARAAEGSLRDAEVMLEQLASFVQGSIDEPDVTALLGAVESETLLSWAQSILDRNAAEALSILTTQLDQGRDPLQLLGGLLRHLRNLLVISTTTEAASREALLPRLIDEPPERLARLEEQATRAKPQEMLLFLQILTGAYELIRRSPMARIVLELVVIKLATQEQWESLDAISRRLEELSAPAQAARPAISSERSAQREPVLPQRAAAARREEGSASAEVAPANAVSLRSSPQPAAASSPAVLPTALASREKETAAAPDEILAGWSVFLERLGGQKMSLAAYLAHASPLCCSEEGLLTVGLPAFALHQEVLSLDENRRLIDRLLGEVYRRPIRIHYTTMSEPSEPPSSAKAGPAISPSAPPIVQDIVNLFNATLLDQPPQPT